MSRTSIRLINQELEKVDKELNSLKIKEERLAREVESLQKERGVWELEQHNLLNDRQKLMTGHNQYWGV